MSVNTQLRVVTSKDPEVILMWVNNLGMKIECKGPLSFYKNNWFLTFILPEDFKGKFPLITKL